MVMLFILSGEDLQLIDELFFFKKIFLGEYALGDFVEIQENIYRIKSIYHVEGDQNLKMDVERLKLRSKGSNELVYTNVSTRMDPNLIANKIHVSMDKSTFTFKRNISLIQLFLKFFFFSYVFF